MSQPPNAVSWSAAPPYGATDPWGPPRRTSSQLPTVLRLIGAALSGLAGALLVAGTFPALVTVDYGESTFELSGWSAEFAGQPSEYALSLGIPLALAASGLLVAAVLAASSAWAPRARGTALVGTLAAASFAVAQVWVVASYVIDWVHAMTADDSATASQGAGYWLLMACAFFAVLSAACLLLAQLPAPRRDRPRSAPGRPVGPSHVPYAGPVGQYAGPGGPYPGPPAPHTGPAGPQWQSGPSSWGGQQ